MAKRSTGRVWRANYRGTLSGMCGRGWRRSQASSTGRIEQMKVWAEPMNGAHSSIVQKQAQHPLLLPPAKQIFNLWPTAFPSHLSFILYLSHGLFCFYVWLQPNQELLLPCLPILLVCLRKQLDKLNRNKVPDGVSPRVPKPCAEQLWDSATHLQP